MSDQPTYATLLPRRGVLRLSGADALSFLQGLVTNDVEEVAGRASAVYSALLTPQGKIFADFFIVSHDGELLLDVDKTLLGPLGRQFMVYKLRADVTIADASSTYSAAALWGPGAATETAVSAEDGALAYPDPRHPLAGTRLLLPDDTAAELLEGQDAEPPGEDAYRRHLMKLGIAECGAGIEARGDFPLEANLDAMSAIDFHKGCFVGQEVASRTKRRGSVRKRLFPVSIEGDAAEGETIAADGRAVGVLRARTGNLGIAMLRLDRLNEAELSGVGLKAGEALITPGRPVFEGIDP